MIFGHFLTAKTSNMFKKIGLLLLTVNLCMLSMAQQVLPLYVGTPPGAKQVVSTEMTTKSTNGRGRSFVSNVTEPTLTIFLPKKMNKAATAMIICPGGGYNRLSIEDGGYEAAKAMADAGIAGIVLKYRTGRDSVYDNFKTVPLQDLEQALNLVYQNAKAWGIDTTNIGILGFSAGAHLTTMGATTFTIRKPAFTLLIYPVISFMDSLTSSTSNSRNNLLGKKVSPEEKIAYSPELKVSKTTPPALLVHAKDDNTSLVGNSLAYYHALLANNVAAELLLYEKGGHGFAMYNADEDKYWLPEALKWMEKHKFYKK